MKLYNIVNYPHLDEDVPSATSYGVYISHRATDKVLCQLGIYSSVFQCIGYFKIQLSN
jgi:hypothetical protein